MRRVEEGQLFFLITFGVFTAALFAGALVPTPYKRLASIGAGLGLLLWLVMAIGIYRGPDNPDLGETGWTIVIGGVIAIFVGAWLAGAAAGRLLRWRLRKDDAPTA